MRPPLAMQTREANDPAAHAVPVERVLSGLDSRPEGLHTGETVSRSSAGDGGQPEQAPWRGAVEELTESLTAPLQLLLIAVGVLSAAFGELRDAIAIFVIVGLVAAVEAVSESRARKALRALHELAAPTARVRRDGHVRTMPRAAVVVGDVVVLQAGDVVVGDGRVMRADGLRADESALTGEAAPVPKGPEPIADDAALAERSSIVFAGTAIVSGSGEAVVVATGERTQLGQLGRLAREASEPPTPLQRGMAELARVALALAVGASVLVPLLGVLAGQPVGDMLLSGLTLAFATIPEELPILVTVLVAVGGLRLARQGVLVRRLRAAEAAGGVTVVMADKTGTLTLNRLRIGGIHGPRPELLAAANAAHGGHADGLRDPIDRALAEEAGQFSSPRGELVARFPFDPVRKRESAVWSDESDLLVFVKGAPETVLSICALSDEQRAWRAETAAELARGGQRVIAIASRRLSAVPRTDLDAERDLEFLGLVGFVDPLRPGVPEAVRALHDAGVRTHVVTGDHPLTAAAIARQIRLGDADLLLGGAALDELSDEQLSAHLGGNLVVARATPADKLRLVRLLQARGDAVAVTGDGVNDAPALAAADVGIAMGKRGTALAREAADLVLTDDAYPTVVEAVRAGRGIVAQLRRAVAFYLGAKVALVACIAVPLALGLPSPFRPVHIVLLELFMDLGASVAFVSEPAAPATMARGPRDPGARFLDRAELAAMALVATALTTATLPAYILVESAGDTDAARAAAIAAWLISHAAVAWTLRVRPRLALGRNPAFPLWAGLAALTAIVVALTPVSTALGVAVLGGSSLAVVMAFSVGGAVVAAIGRRALSLPHRL